MDQAKITLQGAIGEKAVALDSNGDLHIEGWAARYNEPDRTKEYFMPGAFARTWDKFKALGAPLLYQHRDGALLGQVTELTEKAEGVWMEGIIRKPNEDWAKDVYSAVERGFTKGLSAKGMFTKQLLPDGGARIADVDLYEVSVTPVAVGSGATIEAVAAKAITEMDDHTDNDLTAAIDDYFLTKFGPIEEALAQIETALASRS